MTTEKADSLGELSQTQLGRLTEIANTEPPVWFGADAADGYTIAMDRIQSFIEGITQ